MEGSALNDAGEHFVVGLIRGRRDGHGWIISPPARVWRVMAWRTSGPRQARGLVAPAAGAARGGAHSERRLDGKSGSGCRAQAVRRRLMLDQEGITTAGYSDPWLLCIVAG
jgi:hypothetical protein